VSVRNEGLVCRPFLIWCSVFACRPVAAATALMRRSARATLICSRLNNIFISPFVWVLTLWRAILYIVNTARTESPTVQVKKENEMELIYSQDFYKVYASTVGDYVLIWSSDYPTRSTLIGTCDSMEDALEWAKDWVQCKIEDVPF